MKEDISADINYSLKISQRGANQDVNLKICWQAHDEYYYCIQKQISNSNLESKLIFDIRCKQI